jgi:hypothetical protein
VIRPPVQPRVLMFSQRNIYKPEVWRCGFYEFEEIIRSIDSVEMLCPKAKKWFIQGKRFALGVGKRSSIAINPGIPKLTLDRRYDLFFAICQIPSDLLNVNSVTNWKQNCKTSICMLGELWEKEIPSYRSCLKILSQFDYVLLNFKQCIELVGQITKTHCSYIPFGVDALLFCPFPNPPERVIDVLSIGRRSESLHQSLLSMVKECQLFYVYDTFMDLRTFDLEQHRLLLANLAKRSRYFLVNPGKFDLPNESGNQSEIGARYFEGAAAGTILIGEEPRVEIFKAIFEWPDAVIQLPRSSDRIEAFIHDLDMQLHRQEVVRRNNVAHSLLNHDWVYRWETVLDLAGLAPMPKLVERKQQLQNLSKMA